ncbi:hypothetical protein P43SY_011144 [Pythium insidiosum]|uniref:Phosphoglycerate mutase family n=1 Tax=Pythium insidiosum TaxID=114742 RepID=A0AAD5LBM9_PYTIN|nr:hypothetical protein P43SY_011144 [Pythium insidiosum]
MALLPTTESVRALDGFFHFHDALTMVTPVATAPPPLFRHFDLATNTWEELERKRREVERSLVPESAGTAPTRQVKIVYFVRHAEGYHNVAERELGTERWEAVEAKQERFLDADLTPFGISDTESKGPPALSAEAQRGMPPIERVVVSPLSRAIQTAQHFFSPEQAPRPFVVMEACRETTGVHTCDKRRPVSDIRAKFPDLDFSRMRDEEDKLWSPTHRETDDEHRVRARAFLAQLFREIPERYVAVVSHSGFMSAVWSLFHPDNPFKAANCEVVPIALEGPAQ